VQLDGATPDLRKERFDGGPAVVLLEARERVSVADLDSQGRFTVGSAQPGEYHLRCELRLAGSHQAKWVIRDSVTLVPGGMPWALDTATGAIRVLPSDEAHPLWRVTPEARWAGSGELQVFVTAPELDEQRGSRFFPCIPVGVVQLVSADDDGLETVLECVVRPGQTTEVLWPQ